MGQFVKLTNFDKCQNFASKPVSAYPNFLDINGSSYTMSSATNAYIYSSVFALADASSVSSAGYKYLFPYASSDAEYQYSQTSLSNTIGSCTVTFAKNSTGWIANITITGTEDATVNSLQFTKRLFYSSSGTAESLICAYILDSPIELNADNNYTANLTMSIAFTE